MYHIRKYNREDFNLLEGWWKQAGEPGPLPTMMLEDSSFIIEKKTIPVYTLTVYLTNCKEVAYLENFARNPEVKDEEAGRLLVDYVCNFTKNLGYKRVICLTYKHKLIKQYEKYGMKRVLDHITGFNKEL